MSVRLMSAVWDSDLPHDEKFVALALADWADDDGRSVYPSQSLIGWKVGKTDRAVRDTLRKLIDRGVLVKISGDGGGRGITVHYRFIGAALPGRPPYERPKRNPATIATIENPEVCDTKPGSLRPETRKPTSDDPLEIHQEDPSEQHSARVQVILDGIGDGAERLQAVRDTFAGAFRERRGNRSQRERMARLVRRGAMVEDAKHACEVAGEEPRDDPFAYALGVLEGCVKAREDGRDPHERTQAKGRGSGRGVRDRGARSGPGGRRRGTGDHGRNGTATAYVPVRESD